MGYEGAQYDDSDGLSVGTADKPTFEYKYLDGRVRHYKLVGNKSVNVKKVLMNNYFSSYIGEPHGTGPNHPIAQQVVREMILGPGA